MAKTEVRLLSDIGDSADQNVSIHEVAERLGWSDSYASRVVSSLRKRGYVKIERDKTKKYVSVTDIKPVERLGSLTSEFAHVDFPELIGGSGLTVVYYLDEPRTASQLTDKSHVSRGTVYRRLNELQHVGIVRKDHSVYALTEPFSALADFASAVAHHEHRQEALEQTAKVNIVWETHDEYLFGCESSVDGDEFHRTGPSEFANFGIQLLTRERFYYFRSPHLTDLRGADLLCHMLLIDDGARYRSYCLLFMVSDEVERSTLENRANYYEQEADTDLSTLVREMWTYLDSRGAQTSERLPSWEDFKSTASDYGISV